jgi:ParB-like chromosome segregation protein Spo0J
VRYEIHPLADLIPEMTATEFAELRNSIRDEGLRVPIVLTSDGRILDGRHRARACAELDIAPRTATFMGNEAECLDYVLDLNLKRRHLNESQRAMVAAKVANMAEGRPKTASLDAVSQQRAANMLNVSRSSVQRAAIVQAKATPELLRRVERGEVNVSVAAKVAELPEPEQQRMAHMSEAVLSKQSVRAYARRQAREAEPVPAGMEYRIGDCRQVLADIAPNSVALILTDPPTQTKPTLYTGGWLNGRRMCWSQADR